MKSYQFLVLLSWIISTPTVLAYKKDYGFGYMFKFDPNFRERREAESSLNEHIRNVINHYKEKDPVGLPSDFTGFILDPLPVQNFQHQFAGVKILFRDSNIYGLSKFQLERLVSDLTELKVHMKITMDQLQVLGKYMMTAWVSKSHNEYNATITDVILDVDTELILVDEGFLQLKDMKMKLSFGDLKMNFQKLGFMGKLFQGIFNSVGVFIFETIKPTIWNELEVKLRDIVNQEARNIPQQFPNSIHPVDQALAAARKAIEENELDPVDLSYFSTQNSKWSKFELFNGFVYGFSSLRRTGPILLGFERNTIHLTVHLGVEKLRGQYDWTWTALRGLFGRSGRLEFKLEHANIEIRLQQSVNMEKKPIVESINLTLGPASFTSDGIGAMDYILEVLFNVVPNVFRQKIADAAEYRVCKAIEDELQKIDIEKLIDDDETV